MQSRRIPVWFGSIHEGWLGAVRALFLKSLAAIETSGASMRGPAAALLFENRYSKIVIQRAGARSGRPAVIGSGDPL
jgi:hypothetical protein